MVTIRQYPRHGDRFLPAASKSLYNWEKTFYTGDKAEVKLSS